MQICSISSRQTYSIKWQHRNQAVFFPWKRGIFFVFLDVRRYVGNLKVRTHAHKRAVVVFCFRPWHLLVVRPPFKRGEKIWKRASPPCGLRNLKGQNRYNFGGVKAARNNWRRDVRAYFWRAQRVCRVHICSGMAARVLRFSSPSPSREKRKQMLTTVLRSGFYYLSRGSIHVVFFELWSMK